MSVVSRFLPRLWFGLLCSSVVMPAFATEVFMLAAGAGYKRPVTELVAAFEQGAEVKIEPMFGNMAQVLNQVSQSGKVAVVFGDRSFLEGAKDVGFVRYAHAGSGRLVLAWPKGGNIGAAADLADPRLARIALPDTRHAIYGRAAAQFLERGGLKAAVEQRLLMVSTVPQVSAYLVSGEVDAGFINLTEALGLVERIGGFVEIEAGQFDPIEIVVGVLPGHESNTAVAAFEAFLGSPEAKAIMVRHGL